ncbi:hypothetical protein ASF74_07780 [Arthrobacter sp. Leaf145]|nr:hypothetical protein ASF74_07780 [Arthrobacter sp. Leaf145]
MADQIRSVLAHGPGGCRLHAVRGQDEYGDIVDTVEIEGRGEVWDILWQDGTTMLWFQASDS